MFFFFADLGPSLLLTQGSKLLRFDLNVLINVQPETMYDTGADKLVEGEST